MGGCSASAGHKIVSSMRPAAWPLCCDVIAQRAQIASVTLLSADPFAHALSSQTDMRPTLSGNTACRQGGRVRWGEINRLQRTTTVKLIQLRHFVVVAQELHFPRAAQRLGISLQALYSSIEKIEEEVAHPVITRGANTHLTPSGVLLLDEAHARIADAPQPSGQKAPAGGKAKANKGKGRAPVVKGQPKPYKKRQGR